MSVPTLKLNNGEEMPMLGLGTWQAGNIGAVQEAVEAAIDAGYRHIDTALVYEIEKEVGAAIKKKIDAGVVKREDLFVVSKLWDTYHHPDHVEAGIKRTLADLQLDYLDLYLIHWPMGMQPGDNLFPQDADGKHIVDNETDKVDTWKAMEKLVDAGLTKSIGLSNFNKDQTEKIIASARIPPQAIQVEIHPYFANDKLIKYAQSKDIAVTGYSPFACPAHPNAKPGERVVLDEPILKEIGDKYGKRPSHVILRWLIQRNTIVIPKSSTPSRIVDNKNIFDFELSADDMKKIDALDKGPQGRFNVEDFLLHSKDYPFHAEY